MGISGADTRHDSTTLLAGGSYSCQGAEIPCGVGTCAPPAKPEHRGHWGYCRHVAVRPFGVVNQRCVSFSGLADMIRASSWAFSSARVTCLMSLKFGMSFASSGS